MKVKSSNTHTFEIKDQPFASGGQGGIHEVLGSTHQFPVVAKIYHKAQAAKEAQKKIEYMVQDNPFKHSSLTVQNTFAWPIDAIYDSTNGKFIGYLMAKIEDAKPLWHLITPKGFKDSHWSKFNLDQSDSLIIRLKLLYNVAQAFKVLQDNGNYRVVDLKPINMMLKHKGHMVIIDVDSFQIATKNSVLFHAEAATGEYCPPEFHKGQINFQKNNIGSSWDNFAFAVTAYQVLFCIHPFTGSHTLHQTQEDLIKAGIWAHGSKSGQLKTPPPHANFKLMSRNIQAQFIKCFDAGYTNPNDRPDFNSWVQTFLFEIDYITKNKIVFSVLGGVKSKPKVNTARPHFAKPGTPKLPLAAINRFQITPGVLANTATLTWDVNNAVSILLDGKSVSANGSISIPSVVAKNWELKAFDTNGIQTSRNINYQPEAIIITFSNTIHNGYINLNWNINGMISEISINGNRCQGNSGTLNVPIGQIVRNYQLQITSRSGYKFSLSQSISPLVSINNFDKILDRSNAKISWEVSNAASITLNGKATSAKGNVNVLYGCLPQKIKAWDVLGNVIEKEIDLNVMPTIKTFGVTTNNYTAELKWDVWYAKTVWIDNQMVNLFGSRNVALLSRNFEMTIEDFSGRKSKKIISFDAPKVAMRPIAKIKDLAQSNDIKSIGKISQITDRISRINKIFNN